jgi:hypothetical protein
MKSPPSRFDRLLGRVIPLLPFVCLTAGAWLIAPSAGLITFGALVWLDLQVQGASRRKRR